MKFINISTFHSFKNRNFRLFFIGQTISLLGTWMQKTAVSWLVYSLTQSKFMLGISVFATLFPTALFSLYGGIVADRHNRYQVLLATQIVSLLQAMLLTISVIFFKDHLVWVIIFLGGVLGIINGFDMPARQSMFRDLVKEKSELPNALALNSSMVNLSKLIGPAIAGFILERYGNEICFGLNALSFIPVLISLLLMKLPHYEPGVQSDKNLKKEFLEAYSYIKKTSEMSSVILFVGFMSLLALPFSTLTPVFAKDIFHGSAVTLGIIDGVIGLGAFIGALFLASLHQGTNLTKVLAINSVVFGIGLILFSQINIFPVALIFITIGAFGMMSIRTITNTIVQIHVPNHFRGRVISIYLMVVTSLIPIGSLLISAISHLIGVKTMVLIQGFLALIISTCYVRYLKREKLKKENRSLLGQTLIGELT